MKLTFRRHRTTYRCGNCGETFRTEKKLGAHRTPACPLVVIERDIRAWNERVLRHIEEFDV